MKRFLACLLSFVCFHAVLAADAFALAPPPQPTRQAVKVAEVVNRLGSGEYALAAVKLQDKTVVKGRVRAIERDVFVLVDPDSGAERRIPFSAVERLQGYNLATGRQVHVGGGFRAGVARAAMFLLPLKSIPVSNSLTGGEKTLLVGIIVGVLLAILLAKVL